MEFLVTMTTQVPAGTTDDAVADVRAREAENSRELAAQGVLLRLWRPPLDPGEWRTLGLFAAVDDARLHAVLAAMPLRIWRSDVVTRLLPHPNDPAAPPPTPQGREFLTAFTVSFPPGMEADVVDGLRAREAARTRELAGEGHLKRLWSLETGTGGPQALGLWQAPDSAAMAQIVASLPLDTWMLTETTPLTPHPSDPAGGDA